MPSDLSGVGTPEDQLTAFDAFVVARWPRLVRSAALLGLDAHAAEDAVQTALARCCFRWDRIARTRDPDAYVHRVLINVVRAGRRRRWGGELPTADLPDRDVADPTGRVDDERSLWAALQRLPEGQRQVVVLRYYADLSEAQVAEVLDVARGTVKSRCARALATLASDETLAPPGSADRGAPSVPVPAPEEAP